MSNTVTLRKKTRTLSLISLNEKEFCFYYSVQEILKNIFEKKGVVVLYYSFNTCALSDFLDIDVYYRTKNLSVYRKKLKACDKNAILFNNDINLNILLNKYDKKRKYLYLKITNYNKKVSQKKVSLLYVNYKKFFKALFSRRFNLFIDFIKITTLFLRFDRPNFAFLESLCQIFRILTKKHHSRYILFLKYVFNDIINHFDDKVLLIKGLKLILSGKIKGKTRSSIINVVSGSVPINTISSDISFYKMHCYTMYGAFGFKLWVNRKNKDEIRTV